MPEPPTLWRRGTARLLDFGRAGDPVALVVPSLVNRPDILDLTADHSMLRFFAAGGLRPLLLDWGWPGPAERRCGLTDIIDGPLADALAVAAAEADGAGAGPPSLVGYCMGGTLAVAVAQRFSARVGALALLATPWDFSADPPPGLDVDRLLALAEPAMALTGTLPVDALQTLFAAIEPGAVARKYRAFAATDQRSERAKNFVVIEDWLNDGVPLAAPVAREVFRDWYGRNAPMRGEWRVGGAPVAAAGLRLPAFVAIPSRDRIVPPGSARALARAIPGAVTLEVNAGHVGMVAGPRAEALLWRPLRDWLLARAQAPAAPQPRATRLSRKKATG